MAYTHFIARRPGGYVTMYFDREKEAIAGNDGQPGFTEYVPLGCNIVRLATTPSRNLVLPSAAEIQALGCMPTPTQISVNRATSLIEASRHDSLDDLVDSARTTWRSLLKGEVVETVQSEFAAERREVHRDDIVTDSGIIIIDSEQRFQAALASPPTEFASYRAEPHEIDAIEHIARVPVEFLPPHPEDLLSRLYL